VAKITLSKRDKIDMGILIIIAFIFGIITCHTAHAANDRSYMVGYNDGKVQANNDWGRVELHVCPDGNGHCPISYPLGHTPEYYAGYKTGYNSEISYDAE
jgi:hypothetical protein